MEIVEKLRATEMRETGWELGGIPITKLTRINPDGPEAADEIERLRGALEKVLSVQPIKGDEGSTDIVSLAKALLEIDSIARAALKGKE